MCPFFCRDGQPNIWSSDRLYVKNKLWESTVLKRKILRTADSFHSLSQVSSIQLGLPYLRKASSSEEWFCTLICTLTQQSLWKKLCGHQTYNRCQKLNSSSRFWSETTQQDAWKWVELPTLTSAKVLSHVLKILPGLLITGAEAICPCKSQD